MLPPKKDVMLALLERSSVFIHLDPRAEGVRVPAWFKNQPQLVLQVGLNMAVRIPDLSVEDDAISCTLSFSRSPFFCYLPWGSVFALFGDDGKGMLWPSDVPREVAAQQAELARKEQARARLRPADAPPPGEALEQPTSVKPAQLAAVPSAAAQAATGAREGAASGDSSKDKGGKKARKRRPVVAPAPEGGPSKAPAATEQAGQAGEAAAGRDSKRKLPPYLRIVK